MRGKKRCYLIAGVTLLGIAYRIASVWLRSSSPPVCVCVYVHRLTPWSLLFTTNITTIYYLLLFFSTITTSWSLLLFLLSILLLFFTNSMSVCMCRRHGVCSPDFYCHYLFIIFYFSYKAAYALGSAQPPRGCVCARARAREGVCLGCFCAWLCGDEPVRARAAGHRKKTHPRHRQQHGVAPGRRRPWQSRRAPHPSPRAPALPKCPS